MLDYLSVGVVLKPHGLKGEIKVKPLSDEERRFDALTCIYLNKEEDYKELAITARRYDRDFVYLHLEGYCTVESVEPLRGQYLWIPRKMARVLPKDTFFIGDLIGCRVWTDAGKFLGTIENILRTGSNDVYAVKGSEGEVLIPALKSVVTRVDPSAGRMIVDLSDMKGLLPDEN